MNDSEQEEVEKVEIVEDPEQINRFWGVIQAILSKDKKPSESDCSADGEKTEKLPD